MPFYQKRGKIPSKKHTQFRNETGELFSEELVSRGGFSSVYSNIYHTNPPTALKAIGESIPHKLAGVSSRHQHLHIDSSNIKSDGDSIFSRIPLFYNEDIVISKAHVSSPMNFLYRNGCSDEILFIHEGTGSYESSFGIIDLKPGDYLVIPRGVIWKIIPDDKLKILVIESREPIETPKRYRNEFGQLLEHSPFCERDIVTPKHNTSLATGQVDVMVKLSDGIQKYTYLHHPFDVIGWDGYYYPYAFNISDFMPITGKIHQPPPVHQTFQSKSFVVCSFVPRLFDYHPNSIPAPYAHSNIDSDEIIYYVDGDFMSRKGVKKESITYHPMGLPHGPQPGKTEESIGAKETNEFAVMIDTFKKINITKPAMGVSVDDYPFSWIEK